MTRLFLGTAATLGTQYITITLGSCLLALMAPSSDRAAFAVIGGLLGMVVGSRVNAARRRRRDERRLAGGYCFPCNGSGKQQVEVGFRAYVGPGGGVFPQYRKVPCVCCGGTGRGTGTCDSQGRLMG